jgi:hypothetical protein
MELTNLLVLQLYKNYSMFLISALFIFLTFWKLNKFAFIFPSKMMFSFRLLLLSSRWCHDIGVKRFFCPLHIGSKSKKLRFPPSRWCHSIGSKKLHTKWKFFLLKSFKKKNNRTLTLTVLFKFKNINYEIYKIWNMTKQDNNSTK